MKSKHIRQWLSILMAAALTLGSPVIPIDTAVTTQAAEAVILAESDEREVNFNKDWKFFLDENGEDKNAAIDASAKDYNDSSWKDVNLPHDFQITEEFSNKYEAESGFLPGGTGWYRKTAVFPASYSGKSVILNFDGVYNNAYVYVNGTKLGEHHYGYTNFSFDISDQIKCDGKTENVIAVKAVNEFPSSRWYSGSGIYRDVTLTVVNPVHVSLNGTYVTTPRLESEKDGDVTVNAVTTVQNDSNTQVSASISTTIKDSEGNVVSKAAVENTLNISAGDSTDQEQEIIVSKPKLWDCDNPNLYYVNTVIKVGGSVVDTYVTEFGFRYIKYDPNTGFYLNGTPVKMKGVCMHHDQGALGAIALEDAITRQVEKLKEMGCNAIRTSHNAPSRKLLKICNRLGMLVMDEAYDGWSYHKNENSKDFGTYWNETLGENNSLIGGSADMKYYQFCLESFINRDKNDPCNVMWSIGNEINFGVPNLELSTYVNEYKTYASNMIRWIQAIDSTRPITHGDNNAAGNVNDLRTQVDMLLAESGGVVGLNYSPGAYAGIHSTYPNWPLVGSETASSINSRGVYYDKGKHTEPGNYQNTAYDIHAVSWGQKARQAWLPIIQNDYMMGTFIWTGFDYIGEPTDWNGTGSGSVSGDSKAIPNSSYFGIIDTAGFPKDSYYFYTSQWREDKTTLHVVPGCWNRDDLVISNGKVQVDIYSNAPKVELLLNGTVIGTAERTSISTPTGFEYGMYSTTSNDSSKCTAKNSNSTSDYNNLAAQFEVAYEEGTLSARAYDENGTLISDTDTIGIHTVKTNSDEGSKLKVTPEKTEIKADGTSLVYIDVDILDTDGEFASQADNNIQFTLSGYGKILGVDNGNASTIDKFQQKSVLINERTANINAFSGKALVIVQSKEVGGDIKLKVESKNMEPQTVVVKSVGEIEGGAYLENYVLETEYNIDMGTKPAFQTTVSGTKSDGSNATASVKWNEVGKDIYNTPGDYWINGTMTCDLEEIAVAARLHVKPVIVGAKHYSTSVLYGTTVNMPESVSAVLSSGASYGSYPVTWDEIPDGSLSNIDDVITVNGTMTLDDNRTFPTTMTIRAADYTQGEPNNIAPDYDTLTESCSTPADNLLAITDGSKDGSKTTARWTNWNDALLNSSPVITFTWENVKTVQEIILYYFTDENVSLPKSTEFYAKKFDSDNFTKIDVTATDTDTNDNNKTVYTFNSPQNIKYLRIVLTCQDRTGSKTTYVGLSECEIYDDGIICETKNTALLSDLTVNNATVPGFSPDHHQNDAYSIEIKGNKKDAVIAAKSKDNASVTIVQADNDGVARVIVESEDTSISNVYSISLLTKEDIVEQLQPEISSVTTETSGKKESEYTKESWEALQSALKALQTAMQSGTGTEVKEKLENLKTAMNSLKKATTSDNGNVLKTGTTYPADNKTADYQVITSTATGGTVTFVKPAKKTNTKFIVPDTVKIQGHTYTVTKIANNAFKNNKKLKTVTIGKNITEIGKSAFAGDKKLKTIKIQSTVLTNVGKKAFKGIADKAKIKVPKSKKKQYKKILKGRGQKSSVKIS